MRNVVCAWCGRRIEIAVREPSPNAAVSSHGICLDCERALIEDLNALFSAGSIRDQNLDD